MPPMTDDLPEGTLYVWRLLPNFCFANQVNPPSAFPTLSSR